MSENIQKALEHHYKKYGMRPNILEYSDKLSACPNVDGVESTPVHIPANILLIGVKQ